MSKHLFTTICICISLLILLACQNTSNIEAPTTPSIELSGTLKSYAKCIEGHSNSGLSEKGIKHVCLNKQQKDISFEVYKILETSLSEPILSRTQNREFYLEIENKTHDYVITKYDIIAQIANTTDLHCTLDKLWIEPGEKLNKKMNCKPEMFKTQGSLNWEIVGIYGLEVVPVN
jgi:hypothetical protein